MGGYLRKFDELRWQEPWRPAVLDADPSSRRTRQQAQVVLVEVERAVSAWSLPGGHSKTWLVVPVDSQAPVRETCNQSHMRGTS